MRLIALQAVLLLGLTAWTLHAQRPDFSGVWVLDPGRSDPRPYGQMRVIWQTADVVDFTAVQYIGPPQISGLHVIPWKLRVNRWGPRRGGENSREPRVQARWDGKKLIYVKSPGESYSVLFIWTLTGPNELLVEGVEWHSIPTSFDFREKSIPSAYGRSSHYYRRVDTIENWSPKADGRPVTVNLKQDQLTVTCGVVQCRFF